MSLEHVLGLREKHSWMLPSWEGESTHWSGSRRPVSCISSSSIANHFVHWHQEGLASNQEFPHLVISSTSVKIRNSLRPMAEASMEISGSKIQRKRNFWTLTLQKEGWSGCWPVHWVEPCHRGVYCIWNNRCFLCRCHSVTASALVCLNHTWLKTLAGYHHKCNCHKCKSGRPGSQTLSSSDISTGWTGCSSAWSSKLLPRTCGREGYWSLMNSLHDCRGPVYGVCFKQWGHKGYGESASISALDLKQSLFVLQ